MGKRKNESLIFTVHSGKERCREEGGGGVAGRIAALSRFIKLRVCELSVA